MDNTTQRTKYRFKCRIDHRIRKLFYLVVFLMLFVIPLCFGPGITSAYAADTPIHVIRGLPLGNAYTIDGIVTFVDGNYYYVQEPDATNDADPNTSEGIVVYFNGSSLGWAQGDSVVVTGVLGLNNTRYELVPVNASDAVVLSSGNDPMVTAWPATIPYIADRCEGMLVQLANLTIGTIDSSGNTPVYDQDGNTLNIYKIPALTGVARGDRITLTAVATRNESFYLLVRGQSDVSRLEGDSTAPLFSGTLPSGTISVDADSVSLTFSELVQAALGQSISIDTGSVVYSADLQSVLGSDWVDKSCVIPFSALKDSENNTLSLTYSGTYTVTIPAGAFSDIAGNGTALSSWQFTTETAASPVWPLNSRLTATEITKTTMTLNWTSAEDTSGISGYRLYRDGTQIASVDGDVNSYRVSGLSPGTRYLFQVQAGNADSQWTTDGPSIRVRTDSSSGGGSGHNSVTYYTITAQPGQGGKIILTSSRVAKNGSTAFTVLPDPGYQVADVLVNGGSVGAVSSYTLQNVTADTTVQAVFVKQAAAPSSWKNPFTDLAENTWYYDAVVSGCQKGLFSGTGPATFSPDSSMTRAMFVTVLAKMHGADLTKAGSTFADVSPDSWYAGSVAWASQNNIVSGVGDNRFAPDQKISREEMMVILYNYSRFAGMDVGSIEDTALENYSDSGQVSSWANTAMRWAVSTGLVSGKSGNSLYPKDIATRAEAAVLLYNFADTFDK